MRRDPIPIAHTITYERWNSQNTNRITDAEWRGRKKWCVERLGMPGRFRAVWWNESSNNYFRLHFSNMEDVTLFLLVWDR